MITASIKGLFKQLIKDYYSNNDWISYHTCTNISLCKSGFETQFQHTFCFNRQKGMKCSMEWKSWTASGNYRLTWGWISWFELPCMEFLPWYWSNYRTKVNHRILKNKESKREIISVLILETQVPVPSKKTLQSIKSLSPFPHKTLDICASNCKECKIEIIFHSHCLDNKQYINF